MLVFSLYFLFTFLKIIGFSVLIDTINIHFLLNYHYHRINSTLQIPDISPYTNILVDLLQFFNYIHHLSPVDVRFPTLQKGFNNKPAVGIHIKFEWF
jgi:hypothetical protein